jgi:hypothetical protein
VGPVLGATSRAEQAYRAAQKLGINLFPWQQHALWVEMETGPDKRLRYTEAADVVARQNGKTEKLLPRIVAELLDGRRIVHTAQNRIIPRGVFLKVARSMRADGYKVREANGQEEVSGLNGGSYKLTAPQRGVRGLSADTLIIDEVREYEDFEFIAGAEPILTASDDPQTLYLSNAGDDSSVVLNDLRLRGTSADPGRLAYMEWSADPALATDDRIGWRQANPSPRVTMETLERLYQKYSEAGELSIFETEHLCRWVVSMLPRLVQDVHWQAARGILEPPRLPALGVSVDPSGKRASAVMAWPQSDGTVGIMEVADVTGDPIDLTALAVVLEERLLQYTGVEVAYDPWTDQHLARHFPTSKAITGQELANATERFVRQIETGQLRWQVADAVAADLPWASRKVTVGQAFVPERSQSNRSITAVLAAIRAVWLASAPMQKAVLY